MKSWQLHEAKSRFSEVVRGAEFGEVQVVTKHGRKVAVVLDYQRYLQLTATTRSVWQSLEGSPDLSELNLVRNQEPVLPRDLA